ncbi:MAG TPA: DUF2267 domain-containing protein [Acidimicrobiales bacterium]|nr:DUF2267 domain-containing protein [Acidimicrobiales bacterium]
MRPDSDVDDRTLADRVRSTLGPLEKRLDVPRVHVQVVDKVAALHGDVTDDQVARRLEAAAAAVPGVRAVATQLHPGLLASDTKPSQGRHTPSARSPAMVRLIDAARDAGADDDEEAERLAGAVVSCFAARLPPSERAHVLGHLPRDARRLASSPPRWLAGLRHVRDMGEFVLAVASAAETTDLALVEAGVAKVIAALRALVPEEGADVAAVLPRRLRQLWGDPAGVIGQDSSRRSSTGTSPPIPSEPSPQPTL